MTLRAQQPVRVETPDRSTFVVRKLDEVSSPGLAKPNQIWVYNFIANPADMPTDSSIGTAGSLRWR